MTTFRQFIEESINDRGILKALFVVGIPGAGKSYTITQLKGAISPKVVNTDRATEFLSRKLNIPSTSETWKTLFRDDAHRTTLGLLYGYVNSMLPLFVDGTSNDVSNILGRVGILESIGYDVGMVFVLTDLDAAHARARKRGEEIGRHVDPSFIDRVHTLSLENKKYLRGKFGFFKEVNNSPGELDDAAILRIYRQVAGFYAEPVRNVVGTRTLEKLREEKQGYLVPAVFEKADLKKKIEGWYRS